MRDRAARGRSWKLSACTGISAASPLRYPCARSASRGIAWHRSAHLGIPRAPRGGAAAMAGEVRGDASDRWGGATSRTSLPLPRRAVTRNGPHGGHTGAKRPLSWGSGVIGPRHAMLGLAPERRCGRMRYAYAAHHTPQLRHKDASVVETRWVEARWLQRLHCASANQGVNSLGRAWAAR